MDIRALRFHYRVRCEQEIIGQGTIVDVEEVFVKIEICPPGQRQAEVYASSARDDDPACRLAFRVRFTNTTGSEIQYYEQNPVMTREKSLPTRITTKRFHYEQLSRPRAALCSPPLFVHEKFSSEQPAVLLTLRPSCSPRPSFSQADTPPRASSQADAPLHAPSQTNTPPRALSEVGTPLPPSEGF